MIKILSDLKIVEYTSWVFPGGEVGVKLNNSSDIHSNSDVVFLVSGILNSEEIFKLLHLIDAVYEIKQTKKQSWLSIQYLPYARQDRVCNPGENFALKVFLEVLSTVKSKIENFFVVDLHSKVSEHLLLEIFPGFLHVKQHRCLESILTGKNYNLIIAPDKGALEKSKLIYPHINHIYLNKTRTNGKVVYDDLPFDSIKGKAVVVDDICDGGATFVSLGRMLRATQPNLNQLDLAVTHGIFSKGLSNLKVYFDNVYCYHNMNPDLEMRF